MRASLFPLAALLLAAGASAQGYWWVDPVLGLDTNPGTQAQPFKTIARANNVALSGDVIRLVPGIHGGSNEPPIVLGDKDIHLVGAGKGVSIIRPHPTLTINVSTGFPNAPVPTQQRPVVLCQNLGRVDFSNLTIDGNFAMPANGRLVGLYYRLGSDGVLSNVEIVNCRANPLNGSQNCAGLILRGDNPLDPCNVALRDCVVHDWGKSGCVAFFNSTLVLETTCVIGAGHIETASAGPAQNGVQISYNAGGLLRRSTITNMYYNAGTATATGVLTYDAANTVLIEDCGIGNVEAGIYCYGPSNPLVSLLIRRCRVHAAEFGITLDNIAAAVVRENHFMIARDGVTNAAYDNFPANIWERNHFSSYNGIGGFPIPGAFGNGDAFAQLGLNLFATPQVTALPSGQTPTCMVVDQLDGSGGSDFATACVNGAQHLTVGLNTGGAFSVATQTFSDPSGVPVAIVTGEFDGNPGRDLAVLTRHSTFAGFKTGYYVFANNGSGSFSLIHGASLPGFYRGTGLAAADLNGDGRSDLVIANGGNLNVGQATLLLNNGSGTSFTASLLPGGYTKPCTAVAIADIDNDGNRDIVITEGDATVGRLHLLLGNGAGVFTPAGSSPLAIRNDPTAVTVGDLDGDGDGEIVCAVGTTTGGGVVLFENFGGLSFERTFWPTNDATTALATGNLDADFDPDTSVRGDVVVANAGGGTLTLLGTYLSHAGFDFGGHFVRSANPVGVAMGNFNGDIYQDVFYADGAAGTVVAVPGRPTARFDNYGEGCAGTSDRIPGLTAIGVPALPTQPNPWLGIELNNGKPFSLAAIVDALAPAPFLTPCGFLLGGVIDVWVIVTDVSGAATILFPIPASPNIRGIEVYFQGGVLDPLSPLGVFAPIQVSLTRGLKLRAGW